jgi:hypothetical protein
MATKQYKLPGKVAWAKVFTPDEYLGVKKYKLNFFPDNEEQFKNTGIRTQAKSNNKPDFNVPIGNYYTLSRPVSKEINNEVVEFDAPKVYDSEGGIFNEGIIGNGSSVEVKFSVYDTKMGKGHRLEAIRVTELVVPEMTDNQKEESKSEPSVKTNSEDAPW